MTADTFAEDVKACLDSGMDAHVPKPIDTKLLFKQLRLAIQKNKDRK